MILRLTLKDKKGKTVYKGYRLKKAVMPYFIVASWQKFKPFSGRLVIEYRKGWFNSGIYNSLKELKNAYRAFTEKSLIDYVG